MMNFIPAAEVIERELNNCPGCSTPMQPDLASGHFICIADSCKVSTVTFFEKGTDIEREIHYSEKKEKKRFYICFNITWKDSFSFGFQSVLQYSQFCIFIGPITISVWRN